MDLWIEPNNANKLLLCEALQKVGFDETDLIHLKKLDFTKHLVFSIGNKPQKIDFITHVNLVNFQEAYANKVSYEINNITLPLVRLKDLKLMKMNTGRPKDASDIDEFQKINNSI